jgi:hypothetical protein
MPDNRGFFGAKCRKNLQARQAPSSLSRFALKSPKNRLQGDFYPANCVRMPDNRGFFGAKCRKNLQAQQAPSG